MWLRALLIVASFGDGVSGQRDLPSRRSRRVWSQWRLRRREVIKRCVSH